MTAPLVERFIAQVIKRHGRKSDAKFFEVAYNELGPFARRLEDALREGGAPQALFDRIAREFGLD